MSVKENFVAIFLNSLLYKSILSKSWFFNVCLSITATNSPLIFSLSFSILFFTLPGLPLKTNSFIFVSSLHIEIDLLPIIFSKQSRKIINLWFETKNTQVLFSSEIFLTRSAIFFLDFGTKPKKTNSDIGNPDNCKPHTIEEGPGTDVTLILFAIQYCTKLYPGSEISGDPASDIKTQFLFFNKTLIWFIILCSL